MDLNFFSSLERIKGYDITNGARRPCVAYGFDEDEGRFLVADLKTGAFALLALDDFAADVHGELGPVEDDEDEAGVYISGNARKFLEKIAGSSTARFLDELSPSGHGKTTTVLKPGKS